MDLSQLAALLRENGDEVLNGVSKLSLSTKLLQELNEKFSLIVEEREAMSSTFQVISTSNSKVELLLDLQFLHDFVQRTVGLKLIQEPQDFSDSICISKFKNLKLLELNKVPIKQITGLQSFRTQLQYIICIRCLENLKDLFIHCGADKSEAFVWNELKEAVLSYNNLKTIDQSFEYIPWLQTLDISHNSIIDAQPIDCLPNLKHLNIGFNHLESVPLFKKELFRNLQILILKSNYISDLTGLLYLDNLVTLDLSCNCLIDHQSLSPLSHLAALQWLNLEGNPLSFHPTHREITCRYLHSNTSTVKFILDRVLLSKVEKKLIGTYYPSSNTFGLQSRREHQSSICSNVSELTSSSNATDVTQIATSELIRSQSSQRIKKIRNAVISENEETTEIINTELNKSVHSTSSFGTPNDNHLETQKKIESLRVQFGENWLKNQSGSMMHDILGIEKDESFNKHTSTPYDEDFMKHASDILQKNNKPIEIVVNSPVQIGTASGTEEMAIGFVTNDPDKTDVTSEISANNTFVTANESLDADDIEVAFENNSNNSSDEEQIDEDEEEERPFLAQIQHPNKEPEEIFIILTNNYLKERDTFTAKTRTKWLVEIISSCEIISKDPFVIRIQFDTVRRNMMQREYILDEEEAQKFHREISNIISQKPLSAMNQTVYSCMKCFTQFSHEKTNSKGLETVAICPNPNCASKLVYELDDESTPTNHTLTKNNFKPNERPESPSECSIASETENNPVTQIHVTAEVHIHGNGNDNDNDNKATAITANCSAASVQESSSAEDHQITEHTLRKYESDIEVISNPSQSSIEVLDDHLRPNRKRSSEERRTIIAPTLGTIPDVVTTTTATVAAVTSSNVALLGLTGLTESSSSSSFTESVCTAYDTHVHSSRPASGLENQKTTIQEEECIETTQQQQQQYTDDENSVKSSAKDDEKNSKSNLITSIFGGLFSGPTDGTKSDETEDIIEFSFSENFANIDHRIKYHLYQNIFEDEHENFVWLLKCTLVAMSNQIFDGCIALSTYKVYILLIKEHINTDELSTWLIKKDSYKINRLRKIFTLPWKQGVGLEISHGTTKCINYLCLLQDVERTSHFLAYVTNNQLPDTCTLECITPERPMLNLQQILLSHCTDGTPKDSTICLLSIFSKCIIESGDTTKLNYGIFLVTKTDLYLLSDVFWLLPNGTNEPKIIRCQPINNLVEVDMEELTLDFHFLDEIADTKEEIWTIVFETVVSLNQVITAVKSPWEDTFLVPFQINHKVHSK